VRSTYKVVDEGTLDPLLQNGIWNDVDQPVASSSFEPLPDYP
jgi:hypothetical protein